MYGELSAIGMAMCFSISFVLTRKIEPDTSPLFNNTLRSVVGAVSFSLISIFMGLTAGLHQLPWNLWALIFSGIFFNVILGDTIYLSGQEKIGPANAGAVGTLYPIAAIFIERLILHRQIGIETYIAAFIAGLGVVFLSVAAKTKDTAKRGDDGKSKSESVKGVGLVIIAAVIWAIGTVLTDIALNRSEEILHLGTGITNVIFGIRYTFAALVMGTWSWIRHCRHKKTGRKQNSGSKLDRKTWIIAIIAAILAGYIGSYFNGETARTVGASFAGIVQTATPVLILPLNWLINREKSTARELVGILTILAGVSLLFIF